MLRKIAILTAICTILFIISQVKAEENTNKNANVKTNQMIVVNKAVNKLAFYDEGRLVHIFNVATGASSKLTPEGDFHVSVKWKCPIYYKTMNEPCAPDSPLGPRWNGLDVAGTEGYTYGIHGTNADWSIGTYASHGCIRMHNSEVIWLFDQLKIGTPVTIIRSSEDFDTIATQKGYKIDKIQSMNQIASLYGDTTVYSMPYDASKINTSIPSQKVTVIGTVDGWNQITTSDGKDYWVKGQPYTTEEIIKSSDYVQLHRYVTLYSAPNEKFQQSVSFGEETAQSIEKTKNWYHVTFANGSDNWVKISDVEQTTKEMWNEQQQINTISQELFDSIKEQNNMKELQPLLISLQWDNLQF